MLLDPKYCDAWYEKGNILKKLQRNNEALEASNKFFILIILLDIINVFYWTLNIVMHEMEKVLH